LILRAFQNLPILDQVITLLRFPILIVICNIKTPDSLVITITILKNDGIQKTVNATAPFSMGSLDISGFEGE
jgi:hypothetical protein